MHETLPLEEEEALEALEEVEAEAEAEVEEEVEEVEVLSMQE